MKIGEVYARIIEVIETCLKYRTFDIHDRRLHFNFICLIGGLA